MQNAKIEISDNYIKIYNDNETKYFDKQGNELTNKQVYPNNKLFVSIQNGKYGFVDNNNNVVVEYKYDKAYELNEYGFASVEKDGLWGVIDKEGKEVIAPTYELDEQSEPSFIRTILPNIIWQWGNLL